MTELTIARLSATIHPIPGLDDPSGRVDRMLHHLADSRLDAGLARLGLPDGEWCVRRVDLAVAVDPDDGDARIESSWADAVLESIRRILNGSSGEVVHYLRPHDALQDLVTGIASGRTDHDWAWRQLELLPDHDPSPTADPQGAVLAALERSPHLALQVILSAARTVGIASLHRLLETEGWVRLAAVVGGAVGLTPSCLRRMLEADLAAPSRRSRSEQAAIEGRSACVLNESPLALALVRSGLRPSPVVAASWAVLAVADADPGALRIGAAGDLVALVARGLSRSALGTTVGLLRAGPTGDAQDRSPSAPAGGATSHDPRPTTGTARPSGVESATSSTIDGIAPGGSVHADGSVVAVEPGTATGAAADDAPGPAGAMTVWGGLLFLLATAHAAGIPASLFDDPGLRSRSVRWVMHQLAVRLVPIARQDPAALAFAGLAPDVDAPEGAPASDAETAVLDDAVARWSDATARLFGEAGIDPAEVVSQVARRRGEVVADQGWIDIHLDLADVDVDIRKAGLDLDPGWVPWLGVVVRFIYG